MKHSKIVGGFVPITIHITLENDEERKAFYAIFNHAWFLDAAKAAGIEFADIRGHVSPHGSQECFERFEKALKERFS